MGGCWGSPGHHRKPPVVAATSAEGDGDQTWAQLAPELLDRIWEAAERALWQGYAALGIDKGTDEDFREELCEAHICESLDRKALIERVREVRRLQGSWPLEAAKAIDKSMYEDFQWRLCEAKRFIGAAHLVNSHWSGWATQKICELRPECVSLCEVVDVIENRLVSVKRLNLCYCAGVDDEALSALGKNSSLCHVELRGCTGFTERGLQGLTASGTLLTLDLSGCKGVNDTALGLLAGCNNLRHLKLCHCPWISDAGMQALGNLTALESLALDYCRGISYEGLSVLTGMGALRSVTLNGNNSIITYIGVQFLAHVKRLQHLELHSGTNMAFLTHTDLQWLCTMTGLQHLNLSRRVVKTSGLSLLANLSRLQHLDLNSCQAIRHEGMVWLADLTALRHLDLGGLPGLLDRFFVALRGMESLEYLNVSGSAITDEGMKLLACLTALCYLNFSKCKFITDAGLSVLSDLEHLQYLNLRKCRKITGVGMWSLTRLTGLLHLDCGANGCLTCSGFEWMGGLRKLHSLSFAICENCYGAEGMKQLGSLTVLQHLELCGPVMSSIGFEQLKGVKSLRTLLLPRVIVTNKCLQMLADLTTLCTLWLGRCEKITDDGLKALSHLTGLRNLFLQRCNRISGRGFSYLSGTTSLRCLGLDSCRSATKAGMKALATLTALDELVLFSWPGISGEKLAYLTSLTLLRRLHLPHNGFFSSAKQSLAVLTFLEVL